MQRMPWAGKGQTVGLLGGSFDPPHDGHLHISETALKRFQLDHLWWLVSPGNPLKANGPSPISERLQASRAMVKNPRVRVTDIETQLHTRFTAQTLRQLKTRHPDVRFVWLMGADNLAQFHRWQDWRWIMENVPIGVLARPGERISARLSKASRVYRQYRLQGRDAGLLPHCTSPCWCFINLPMTAQSSSAIRARGEWG